MGLRLRTAGSVVAIVLAAFIGRAIAQEVSASLHGRVTDAAGRPLSGVSVVAQSANLIGEITSTTGVAGDYVLSKLPPGNYVITFSRAGLVPVKRTMRLSSVERATAHVVLRPENYEGAVTVTHERLAFPPSSATIIDTHALLQVLPTSGSLRSVVGLTTELPGKRPSGSLFLFDGMPLRHGWNLANGEGFAGPGPEATNELTVVPGRLPADYGRLAAGTIALVTSAGGRRLSGALRGDFGTAGLTSDLFRLSHPVDGPAGTFEYTVGGAIPDQPTWFFASGRHLTESTTRDTLFTDDVFATDTRERLGLARVTHAFSNDHRVEGQWVGVRQQLANAVPAGFPFVADPRALETRALSDRVFSGAYTGRWGRAVDVAARYTREDGTARVSALAFSDTDSLASRASVVDQSSGAIGWSPGACLLCDPHRTTHDTFRVTASGLLPGRLSSHHVTVGFDNAVDVIEPAGVPNGGAFDLVATRLEQAGESIVPVFAPGGSSWIAWTPDTDGSLRFRSNGLFVHDRWTAGDTLTVDVGLRYDRMDGTRRSDGLPVLDERAFSPRVGFAWGPAQLAPWTFEAGFGRYVSGPLDRLATGVLAPRPLRLFVYEGPPINTSGPSVATGDAVQRALDWFASAGGTSRTPWFAAEPGISTRVPETIASPRVDEWSFGGSRVLGEDGYVRVDFTWRTWNRLAARRVGLGEAAAIDRFGSPLDSGVLIEDERLERRYAAISFTGDYRFGHWADFGMRYTLSSLRGNVDDRVGLGATALSASLAYPEFTSADWNLPVGALPDDARHRARVWLQSELLADEVRGTLMSSVLVSFESGRPYGAVGLVSLSPFVANPGVAQPPVVAQYHFTERDAFRTSPSGRIDLGLLYRRNLPGTVHGQLFAGFDVLNLTNRVRVLQPERHVITRTAFTDSTLLPFNPFTETPVEGLHWSLDDLNARLPTARESVATTMGRAFRVTLGIRF